MVSTTDPPCAERRSARPPRDTVAVGLVISAVLHGLLLVVATSLHAAETSHREIVSPMAVRRDPLMVVLHDLPRPSATKLATNPIGGKDQSPPRRRGHHPTVAKVPSEPATPPPPLPATPPAAIVDDPAAKRDERLSSDASMPAPGPAGQVGGSDGKGALGGGTVAAGTKCCGTGTGAGPASGVAPSSRSPARPIDSPRPIYPRQARLMGWEGTVVLRVFVDAAGRPTEVKVVAGSGHALLDESALDAARRWRFSPALEDGHPIAMAHEVRIRFRLDDQAG